MANHDSGLIDGALAFLNLPPFIGVPSTPFQYEDMKQTGVKYLLNSLKGIDAELLERIDLEAAEQAVWSTHAL